MTNQTPRGAAPVYPRWMHELAIQYRLCHFVQGDDGFGGEDEADERALRLIAAVAERTAKCPTK